MPRTRIQTLPVTKIQAVNENVMLSLFIPQQKMIQYNGLCCRSKINRQRVGYDLGKIQLAILLLLRYRLCSHHILITWRHYDHEHCYHWTEHSVSDAHLDGGDSVPGVGAVTPDKPASACCFDDHRSVVGSDACGPG